MKTEIFKHTPALYKPFLFSTSLLTLKANMWLIHENAFDKTCSGTEIKVSEAARTRG